MMPNAWVFLRFGVFLGFGMVATMPAAASTISLAHNKYDITFHDAAGVIHDMPSSTALSPVLPASYFQLSPDVTGTVGTAASTQNVSVTGLLSVTSPGLFKPLAQAYGYITAVSTFQVALRQIAGPEDIRQVPVLSRAIGNATCAGGLTAIGTAGTVHSYALITFSGFAYSPQATCLNGAPFNGFPSSFNEDSSLQFTVGQPVTVTKTAEVDFTATADYGFTAAVAFSAMADPTFEIDPSFQYARDFVLDFSTDAKVVPEPSTWILELMGLLLISLLRPHAC